MLQIAQHDGALQQTRQPFVRFPGAMSFIIDIADLFIRDIILRPSLCIASPILPSFCLLDAIVKISILEEQAVFISA